MLREIGSEFHKMPACSGSGIVLPIPGELVFSGRTAIETVLMEMPTARKAMLPSYCCSSMIEPFRNAGIEVEFYPVIYDNGLKADLDISDSTDILLWCNYFGFHTPMPDLPGFKGAIIEDVTQSLFSDHSCDPRSDFLVASLRKWEPIYCGGYCAARDGKLHSAPKSEPPIEFIGKKSSAMSLKSEFLTDADEDKKSKYLSSFSESNHWLEAHYSGLSIDRWSAGYLSTVDMASQRECRRRNAKVLYDGLKDAVQFLFPEEKMDCPLFVPILISDRDTVKSGLIERKIYCPSHWPCPEGCVSNLYDTELSLVCDQRYNEEDMKREAEAVRELIRETQSC